MASRTISISEEAYRRLAKNKRPGESFTEVILDVVPDPASTLGELLRRARSGKPERKRRNAVAA